MKTHIAAILMGAVFLGTAAIVSFAQTEKPGAKGEAKPAEITPEQVLADRKNLKLMTPKSVMVDVPNFSGGACGPGNMKPTKPEPVGPHQGFAMKVYMNAEAEKAFKENAGKEEKDRKPYPVGAVVVKEKLSGKAEATAAWGGMIKRAAGYDKDHGDWEFFYIEKNDKKMETGKITSCVNCHNAVAEKDHVYGDWAK